MAGLIPPNLPEPQRHMCMVQGLGMIIDNMLMKQFLEKQTVPINPAEVDKLRRSDRSGLEGTGQEHGRVPP